MTLNKVSKITLVKTQIKVLIILVKIHHNLLIKVNKILWKEYKSNKKKIIQKIKSIKIIDKIMFKLSYAKLIKLTIKASVFLLTNHKN